MIIDSSAAVAFLLNEAEARAFARAIEEDAVRLMPASAVLETASAVEREHGLVGASALDAFLTDAKIVVVPFGQSELDRARMAFRTFGKGRHPARLNFGDCMVYAACKATGEALLFKGADFAKTDVLAHPASVS
jgi:ribonuclease VapC